MTIINKTYAACGMLRQISVEGTRHLPNAQLRLLLMTCSAVMEECEIVIAERKAMLEREQKERSFSPV